MRLSFGKLELGHFDWIHVEWKEVLGRFSNSKMQEIDTYYRDPNQYIYIKREYELCAKHLKQRKQKQKVE